jgi:acid phosphatase
MRLILKDYDKAAGETNQQYLASQGITLTNFWAVTHPSQPNYCASAGGDTFGMNHDGFTRIPANVSTIVDLLDTKGISWGEYQEDMPYAGFQGFGYKNQETYANDYVRKHNPLILFDSVTSNATRLSLIKTFEHFNEDLAAEKLPQWAFLTPNMTNDGHDTHIRYAAEWERNFMTPLLKNSYFMKNTLILLTFDENETYPKKNKIFSVLVGGAIPEHLKGTTDDTFYNHYSTIASVSLNWGLPSLGRWDCNANVFSLLANKTSPQYQNFEVDDKTLYFNVSYPGPLSIKEYVPDWPVPDTTQKCASGLGVLPEVVRSWGKMKPSHDYAGPYGFDIPSGTDVGGSATRENKTIELGGTTHSMIAESTATPTPSPVSTPTKSGATKSAFGYSEKLMALAVMLVAILG